MAFLTGRYLAVQGVQLIGAADDVIVFEGAGPCLVERIQSFLQDERAKVRARQRAELDSAASPTLQGMPYGLLMTPSPDLRINSCSQT